MKIPVSSIMCILSLMFILPTSAFSSAVNSDKFISQYRHTIYNANTGVKDILDILQDQQGFIWLASYSGLIRFDGSKFITFNRSNQEGFPADVVRVLLESKEGAIWMGSNRGLIQYANSQFTLFNHQHGLPNSPVRKLFEDSYGQLWVGTENGLSLFDGTTFHAFEENEDLNNKLINFIFEDENKIIWVGVNEKDTLYQINPQTKQVNRYQGDLSAYIKDSPVEYMLKDKNGKDLWAITGDTLFQINRGKVVQHYSLAEAGLSNKFVGLSRLFQDKQGALWLSSHIGVIRFYQGQFALFSKKDGLNDDPVNSFYQDREGNFWVGTRPGLNKFSESKFIIFDKKNGLVNDSINAILNTQPNQYWIATNEGLGILTTDTESSAGEVKNINSEALNSQIKHLYQDSEQSIWVSTYGLGLVQFVDEEIVKILNTDNGLVSNKVRVVFEDSAKNLWVGTTTGISRISPSGHIDNFTAQNGLTNETIMSFYEDAQGRIWVGTNGGGINIFEKDVITQTYTQENGLAHNVVFKFFQDSSGVLWVTTSGGINRFYQDEIATLTIEQGLLSNTVFQIIEDEQQHFWMTSTSSIFYAPKAEIEAVLNGEKPQFKTVIFDKHSGLQEDPASVAWGIKDANHHLWFPTYGGVATLDPKNIFQNKTPPHVVILDRLIVDGKKYFLFESEKTLEPETKRIEFSFAALSFIVPEKTQFQFKLEGFDNQWSELTTKQETIYTNLRYGQYTFKVRALNNDGIWSTKNAELKIYKKPFFYETIWFRVLLGILILVIILLMAYKTHQIRVRKYKKELKRQQVLIEWERQAKETERHAKEREIILNRAYNRFVPHEFLNILEKDSIIEVQLGDQIEKEMTILFSDIRGFTTISEGLTPKETFDFINTYLSQMQPVIHQYFGFIDKYIGDAIMALFPTQADDALKGAIEMVNQLSLYNAQRVKEKKQPIGIGIGLNTGTLMLGTVGGDKRMDGTVVSDAVNLSSRIEGLTKLYGVKILITDKTHKKLVYPEAFNFREIDKVVVKGKTEAVIIFEVLDGLPEDIFSARINSRDSFIQGLAAYQQHHFETALPLFEACITSDTSDKVAQIYVERCQESIAKQSLSGKLT